MYARAAQFFRDGGNPEKAAETCIKAAKAMTDTDSDGAIKLFIEAIEIYEGEEKHIFIADTWRNCLALMLKCSPNAAPSPSRKTMHTPHCKIQCTSPSARMLSRRSPSDASI